MPKLAGAQLLEPVMAVEVVTPEESLGTVIGDLYSRRGQVLSLNEQCTSKVVDAHAPLSKGTESSRAVHPPTAMLNQKRRIVAPCAQ